MKKSLIYILAITTALVSCSKDLEQDGGLSSTPLVFSPTTEWPEMETGKASGNETKALINSANDLQEYGISLFASATKGENTYLVFNNDELKFTNGTWNYDLTKYWIPGAKYTFAAFAPYAGTTSTGKKISNGTVSSTGTATAPVITIENYISGKVSTSSHQFDARSEDLLFATQTRDNSSKSDYSAVPLQFNHLLSCITFYIRNATSNDIESVSNIKLLGLKFKGTIKLNLTNTTINATDDVVVESDTYFTGSERPLTGESSPFLPRGMSESDYKFLFDCDNLTVLPQTVYGKDISIKFTIKYTSGTIENYTGNLGNIDNLTSWDRGKKYRYNITISSQDILFQVDEVPWIEHEIEL